MQLCFTITCQIHHAIKGLPAIRHYTEYSSICTEYDLDFQEEFDTIIKNSNVQEANNDFMIDVFDYTYLNKKLVIPRDGDSPDLAKVTERLRNKESLTTSRT